jgi:general secretion pathway protein I
VVGTRQRSGFTLLEVMVAIAILGLSLTIILSSQVGLFSSAERTHHLTHATSYARCKMTEIEEEALREGFQLTDVIDEGPCCEDDPDRDFSCAWKIETVELPEMADVMTLDGEAEDDASSSGVLGKLVELKSSASSGDSPLGGGDLSEFGEYLGEDGADGMQGLASSLMGMVYPNLKSMLEASIRRVTLTVTWREGRRDRELVVVQFLTRPQQGLDPLAEEQLRALDGLEGAADLMGAPASTNPPKAGAPRSGAKGARRP